MRFRKRKPDRSLDVSASQLRAFLDRVARWQSDADIQVVTVDPLRMAGSGPTLSVSPTDSDNARARYTLPLTPEEVEELT